MLWKITCLDCGHEYAIDYTPEDYFECEKCEGRNVLVENVGFNGYDYLGS